MADTVLDQTGNEVKLTAANMPQFVRRCWQQHRDATKDIRECSKTSKKMWLGGVHQWLEAEVAKRKSANRPLVSINRLKPAVDQVENEARNNPPGPQARPVGGGSDKEGADIIEGLIREYEYRSNAQSAYTTSLRHCCVGNCGVFEMATEYESERSFEQRIKIIEAEDPDMYFVDPNARASCREDAMWAGKLRVLSREQVIEEYGNNLKILNQSLFEAAGGWIKSAISWAGDSASVSEWCSGNYKKGPYYVAEFYRVEIEQDALTLYSDMINRFDDESVPEGVTPKLDDDGKKITRKVGRRKVRKYVVTALDQISQTDWLGDIIPIFWVMGPEIYIDGKLHRLSLIDGAIDAQRGLNYAATTATEIVGSMAKSGYLGAQGSFDVINAQGFNPWDGYNSANLAYMEYKPILVRDEGTGQAHLAPPPQRNVWEAPIAAVMQMATFFVEAIKGSTGLFFDPSIQSARDAQSGEAIKALQSQSNVGTANWQDQEHRAVTLSYQQAAKILPKIYDGTRVKTIVRPDSKHEIVEINKEFPKGQNGKKNNITLGEYSLRVTSGPNFETRTEKAVNILVDLVKFTPAILNNPAALAQFIRMVGEGSPQVEQIADTITGQGMEGEQTPEQLKSTLAQAIQQNNQLKQAFQKLSETLQAKLPEIEARKYIAELNALSGLREAEIRAGVDFAQQDAAKLEHLTGLAHDAAKQEMQQQHSVNLQQQGADQQAAMQQQQNSNEEPNAE
jgi:hypothetical protein